MVSPVFRGLGKSSEIRADQRPSQGTRNVVSVAFLATALVRRQDWKKQTDQWLLEISDGAARTRSRLPFSPSEPLCRATSRASGCGRPSG